MGTARVLSLAVLSLIEAALLTTCPPACGQDITSNLAAHWKLNETGGSTAADSSGNGRTGTVFGTASWQSGLINNALSLNGSTYVRATGLMGNPSNITVAAWVNLTAADTSGAEVISLGDHVLLRIDEGGANTKLIMYNGSSWNEVAIAQTFAGRGWHHVVGVFNNSSNYLRLYVDGVQAASQSVFDSISYSGLGGNTYIGRHGNGQTSFDFNGKIDDVRVYSRALSPTDVAALYTDGWATQKLLFVHNNLSLTSQEVLRRDQVMEWGYEVTLVHDLDSQSTYNTALADVDVAYVPEEVSVNDVSYKLREATAGVVLEDYGLHDEFGFSTNGGGESYSTTINITDNSHYITSLFSTGSLTITSSSQPLTRMNSSLASGLQVLGNVSSNESLGVIESGGTLANSYNSSNVAWGRRVALPFGGGAFDFGELNSNGRTILQRALDWAANPSQLIGHWKLDETSGSGNGTTANDSSTNGNDGTYQNYVDLNEPGPFPGIGAVAAEFDGNNDYVSVPNESIYDVTGPMTVAAWIKVDQFDTDWQAIVTKGDGSWRLQRDGSTNLLAFAGTGLSTTKVVSNSSVNDGQWHHVVGLYDGSSLKIYLDGQLDNSVSASGSIATNDYEVRIAENSEQTTRNWDGWLFDVRIYSYALTDAEIADLYGLVGWWKLDESSGTTANDSSLLGQDGTYVGGVNLGTEAPISTSTAAEFDGYNEYVTLPTYTTDFSEGFSMTLWARPTDTGNWARFMDIGDGEDQDNLLFARYGTTSDLNGTIHDGSLGPAAKRVTATNGMVNDSWYHYALTVDSTGIAKLYRDGAELASATTGVPSNVTRSSGFIGKSNWAADALFEGRMWDVRLYNRPLSQEEVQEIHGEGVFSGVRITKWVELQ